MDKWIKWLSKQFNGKVLSPQPTQNNTHTAKHHPCSYNTRLIFSENKIKKEEIQGGGEYEVNILPIQNA
jgi:hypothetical protein